MMDMFRKFCIYLHMYQQFAEFVLVLQDETLPVAKKVRFK